MGVEDLRDGPLVDGRRLGPAARQRVARAGRRGHIRRLLPGVWAAAAHADNLTVRAAAVQMADPDAVLTGRIAARLTWWPELECRTVTAVRRTKVTPMQGFAWRRGVVDPDDVIEVNRLRFTSVAATVLELIPELGGQVIDEALRRGVVTMAQLWEAFRGRGRRRGDARRRFLLEDSHDEPWSEAERSLHQILRSVRMPCRFRANHRVWLGDTGRCAYVDAALIPLKLGFEADGRAFHSEEGPFERDRNRDTQLASIGWWIVRFSARQVLEDANEVRERIVAIVRERLTQLGRRRR